MSGTPLKGGPKLVTPEFFFPTPKKGPKWAQKYPILLRELLEMAISTFPAILSQIGDGSIFVKISTKIDLSPVEDSKSNFSGDQGRPCFFPHILVEQ